MKGPNRRSQPNLLGALRAATADKDLLKSSRLSEAGFGSATDNVVVGSVNANKRHWHKAGEALARADRSWLEQPVTRREMENERNRLLRNRRRNRSNQSHFRILETSQEPQPRPGS